MKRDIIEVPLCEICSDGQAKGIIISVLEKHGLAGIKNKICRLRASIEDLADNMGGGIPPDALTEMCERLKQYNNEAENENDDDSGMLVLDEIPKDLRLWEDSWPGLYLHQAIVQAKTAGIDELARAMEVALILNKWEATQDTVIAGILHSSIYGHPEELDGISKFYKKGVTSLLSALNFNKGRTWKQKLDEDLIDAKYAAIACRAVIMAETIADLRKLEKMYLDKGSDMYEEPEKLIAQEEYLSGILGAFDDMQDDEFWKEDYWIMQNLYKEIFVKYYLSKDGNMIYQVDDLSCTAVMKGVSEYTAIDRNDFDAETCEEIMQERAEQLEEAWMPDIYGGAAKDDDSEDDRDADMEFFVSAQTKGGSGKIS